MVRNVVFTDYCDVCLRAHDEQVLATFNETVQIGAVRRQLMLCGPHREHLVDDLQNALKAFGGTPHDELTRESQARKSRPKLAEPIICPACLKPCDNRRAYSAHVRRTHGKSIEDFEVDLGLAEAPVLHYACKEPGCDARFPSGAHLGAHTWNRHQKPKLAAAKKRAEKRAAAKRAAEEKSPKSQDDAARI